MDVDVVSTASDIVSIFTVYCLTAVDIAVMIMMTVLTITNSKILTYKKLLKIVKLMMP